LPKLTVKKHKFLKRVQLG